MPPSLSPVEKALDYLRRGIADDIWLEHKRLPTMKQLALDAKVSQLAMCQAVQTLKKEGVVRVGRRLGIYLGTGEIFRPSQPLLLKWKKLAGTIERDIINYQFLIDNTFPSLSHLTTKYGASYRTLRKALDSLVESRLLLSHKNTYMLRSMIERKSTGSIILYALGIQQSAISFPNERIEAFYTFAQKTCSDNRLSLCCRGINDQNTHDELCRLVKMDDDAIGYMVYCPNLSTAVLNTIVHLLLPGLKPVALIADSPTAMYRGFTAAGQRLKLFCSRSTSTRAGRDAGVYLLRNGHRKIAYVNAQSSPTVWSTNRLNGLREAYQAAGLDNAVVSNMDLVPAIVHPLPTDAQATEIARIQFFFDNIYRKHNQHQSPITRNIGGILANIDGYVHLLHQQAELKPLLELLLKNKSITAWVAVNDAIASHCQQFLIEHHKKVPQDISIIGFDDSIDARQCSITSYNFAYGTIAQRAISFIVNPRNAFFKGDSPMEIDGLMVERESSALKKSNQPAL